MAFGRGKKKSEDSPQEKPPAPGAIPTSDQEGANPVDEDGDPSPHQVESVSLTNAHVGREVTVHEPTKPDWVGQVDGWCPTGIYITPKLGGPRFKVKAEHLKWVV